MDYGGSELPHAGADEFTHVSLFGGIEGIGLAGWLAGFRLAATVEIDEFARAVTRKNFPGVVEFGDVRTVTAESLADAGVGPIDLLSGGFPCQPFSVAGRRRGSDDDRYLWPEFLRVIRETRPRWVLGENVRGLLSIDAGRELGGILRDLAACGYRVGWVVYGAGDVGAPHQRDRVFIVAHTGGPGGGLEEHRGGGQGRESSQPSEPAALRQEDGPAGSERLEPGSRMAHAESEQNRWLQQSGVEAHAGAESAVRDEMGHAGGRGRTGESRGRPGEEPADGHLQPKEELDNANSAGCTGQPGYSASQPGGDRTDNGLPEPPGTVADATGARREAGELGAGREVRDEARREESERRGSDAGQMADAEGGTQRPGLREGEPGGVGGRRSGDERSEGNTGPAQPGLGGGSARLSRWLDGRWPTGPGEAQAEWEPPRTARGVPNRAARVKALGNAVVPQQVLPVLLAIADELRRERSYVGP